jgi:hypothetical protein
MLADPHSQKPIVRSKSCLVFQSLIFSLGDDGCLRQFQIDFEAVGEVCKIAGYIITHVKEAKGHLPITRGWWRSVMIFGRLRTGHLLDKRLALPLHFFLNSAIHSCSTQLPMYVWHA